MFWAKIHGEILAACDKNLLDKKFSEGGAVLELKKNFYGGDLVTAEALEKLLKEKNNINLVGSAAIAVAEKLNMVAETKRIKNIPYAMIFRV